MYKKAKKLATNMNGTCIWYKHTKVCGTNIKIVIRKYTKNIMPMFFLDSKDLVCVCVLGLISGFLFMIIAVIAFIWIHNNEWAMSDTAALDCPQFWLKAIAKLAELFGHTLSHTITGRLTPM